MKKIIFIGPPGSGKGTQALKFILSEAKDQIAPSIAHVQICTQVLAATIDPSPSSRLRMNY